jgi:plastocyanin
MNNTVFPQSLTVARGTQVTFINQDSNVHQMDSDPHPEHTDCVEINQVGFISPGQTRQTGNLNIARRCGFHDHDRPDTASLKGTIIIQ